MYQRVALKKIFMYKQTMKILIKTLVVGVVISLIPVVISELAPEYHGFNLEIDKSKR